MGYKIMVTFYSRAAEDTFTEEYSGIVHTSRKDAVKEFRKAKADINLDPEYTTLDLVEVEE